VLKKIVWIRTTLTLLCYLLQFCDANIRPGTIRSMNRQLLDTVGPLSYIQTVCVDASNTKHDQKLTDLNSHLVMLMDKHGENHYNNNETLLRRRFFLVFFCSFSS
jgi:hypothetical protein